MNRWKRTLLLSLILLFPIAGCSQGKREGENVLAQVNECKLTLEEFEARLAAELELDKDYKLTMAAKRRFLDQLIQKELLIQEAKNLNLDRQPAFVKTIERYWESTLIRELMDLKAREVAGRTYVSEEEIVKRYEEMGRQDQGLPPLENLKERIVEDIKEEKKQERLKEWMDRLRSRAQVKVNEELLVLH